MSSISLMDLRDLTHHLMEKSTKLQRRYFWTLPLLCSSREAGGLNLLQGLRVAAHQGELGPVAGQVRGRPCSYPWTCSRHQDHLPRERAPLGHVSCYVALPHLLYTAGTGFGAESDICKYEEWSHKFSKQCRSGRECRNRPLWAFMVSTAESTNYTLIEPRT